MCTQKGEQCAMPEDLRGVRLQVGDWAAVVVEGGTMGSLRGAAVARVGSLQRWHAVAASGLPFVPAPGDAALRALMRRGTEAVA